MILGAKCEVRTSDDEICENSKKESDTEDDRANEIIEVSWITPTNHTYTVLIESPAVDLVVHI